MIINRACNSTHLQHETSKFPHQQVPVPSFFNWFAYICVSAGGVHLKPDFTVSDIAVIRSSDVDVFVNNFSQWITPHAQTTVESCFEVYPSHQYQE